MDKAKSRAARLWDIGQSVWLDFIRRGHLRSGEFGHLVSTSGVRGVTSNPTIFQQAIGGSSDYDDAIEAGVSAGLSPELLLDALILEDIREACDLLAPLYEESAGLDGRVSIEVNPRLARDTAGTIAEAQRLHTAVARPNVMIKVPATAEGLPAISRLTADGISVNVTLIFSGSRHHQVMDAYLEGLGARAKRGEPLDRIFSVASFFVSRVDTKIDGAIEDRLREMPSTDPARFELSGQRGKAAIANARLAYEAFREVFGGPRFTALAARGAHVQRPLWASTGTKNPAYPDTLYVDELAGPDTVNTMPPHTLDAFNDHGMVAERVTHNIDAAHRVFERLPALGIPLARRIDELEAEGVTAFVKSWDALVQALEERVREIATRR